MTPTTESQLHLVHLFPLPNLLLNPSGKITLNIFEPRYLNLIHSCQRDGIPMAVVHAQSLEPNELTNEDLLTIPHEKFPFIHPEVGFGTMQVIAETEKGAKVVVVSGDYKGRVKKVHKSEGGFLSAEVEIVTTEGDLSSDMVFLYRRMRAITQEKVTELLKNQREVDVLMDNLKTPEELLAFYADHVCRDFSVRLAAFEENNINKKIMILAKSLLH